MRRTLLLVLLCSLAFDDSVAAPIDLPDGIALSPAAVLQQPASYVTFADRNDGVWAVFMDTTAGSALYAQHVLSDGSYAAGFGPQPRTIASSNTLVNAMTATPDGFGGAIVMWFGLNPLVAASPFIALRLQHLDSEGRNQYPDTGIVVSSIATAALAKGDGQGGAYVVWEELKGVSNPDIVAQRYNNVGAPQWTTSGSPTGRNVCAVVGLQRLRALHDDGAGGAYVVWADSRTPATTPLYAMRLTPAGVAAAPWTVNGVRVSPATSGIRIVGSATSPAGGLWVAWRDINIASQLMAQHVSDAGSFLWGSVGALVTSSSPARVEFVPAPAGDVFVTWNTATDIRCSRLNSAGARSWPELTGRVLVTPPAGTVNMLAYSDGGGGQRVAWSFDNAGQSDLNLSHFDGAGSPWLGEPAQGVPIASTPVPEEPAAVIDGSSGSRLVVWLSAGVLRVRRLVIGTLAVGGGGAPNALALASPWPNPLRSGPLTVRFTAPAGPLRLGLFDAAGRRVLGHALQSSGGAQTLVLEGSSRLAPGVYALRLDSTGDSVTRRFVRVD